MNDFGVRDVPCQSCQDGYSGKHSCDSPAYCACDRVAAHVSGDVGAEVAAGWVPCSDPACAGAGTEHAHRDPAPGALTGQVVTIRRRSPNGTWLTVAGEVVPTEDEL